MQALPHTSALLGSIGRLNAWLGDRVLRTYQSDVLSGQGFSVTSPFDGRACTMEASHLLASDVMAYAFQARRFYLIVGPQHEGYPLARMLDGTSGRMWTLAAGHDTAREAGAQMLAAIKRLEAMPMGEAPVHALFGDGNFAHLAWNGLGALAALPGLGIALDQVQFVSRCDPLGDPWQFFPALSGLRLDRWDDRLDVHSGRSFRHATFLGAAHLSVEVASAVLSVSESRASASCLQAINRLRSLGKKVVWISLRKRHRDCTNQVEFIARLVTRLLEQHRVALVFDGFSFPDCACPDFFDDFRDQVNEAFQQVLALCPELPSMIASGDALWLNGGSLHDALSVSAVADFYVCHGGTQQHKIAWFRSIPGVLHVPNPSAAVEGWYAEQSAVSLPPRCLPQHMVIPDEDPNLDARNWRYRIDVDEAVDFILAVFAEQQACEAR